MAACLTGPAKTQWDMVRGLAARVEDPIFLPDADEGDIDKIVKATELAQSRLLLYKKRVDAMRAIQEIIVPPLSMDMKEVREMAAKLKDLLAVWEDPLEARSVAAILGVGDPLYQVAVAFDGDWSSPLAANIASHKEKLNTIEFLIAAADTAAIAAVDAHASS